MLKLIPLVLLAAGLALTSAAGTEIPTSEIGGNLFVSPSLGSNGRSCATCHPGGKGLGETGAYSDAELREMINFCIRDALQGQMLPQDAQELDSLRLYLRSLQAAEN